MEYLTVLKSLVGTTGQSFEIQTLPYNIGYLATSYKGSCVGKIHGEQRPSAADVTVEMTCFRFMLIIS